MNDLTRLMFDDGATRPPVQVKEDMVFTCLGKLWRMVVLTDEECDRRAECDWSFYAAESHVGDPLNIENFKQNMDAEAERLWGGAGAPRPGWAHKAPPRFPTYMDCVFVRFEEVA